MVRDAKPKATVVWYRQNTEFYTGTYFVSQSAPLHRPRPSVRLSAEPRKQQEAERGNERASITDSAGVPNDLPSLAAAQPTRAQRRRRHRQQLPEAKNNSLKVTVQIAFRFLRKEGWSWFCFLQELAAWGRKGGRGRAEPRPHTFIQKKRGRRASEQGAISGFLVFSLTLDCPPLPLSPNVHPLLFPAGGRSLPLYGLAGGRAAQ